MLLPYKGFIYLSNDFLRNKLIMTKSLQNVKTFHRLLCSSIMTININTLSLGTSFLRWRRRVSMPYLGRTSFLQSRVVCQVPANWSVSMTYLGRTWFLQVPCFLYWGDMVRVNALSREHFISTYNATVNPALLGVCQCPISGALHFYEEQEC